MIKFIVASIVVSLGTLVGVNAAESVAKNQETSSGSSGSNYRLEEEYAPAKSSYYTPKILKFLDHWPPPTLNIPDSRPGLIRAIRTPKHSDTIGMVKHSIIKAPLAKVVETNEKFEEYPKIWEDVLSVGVQSRDKNRVVTEWVRKSPAFFLKKIRYRMLYVIDKSNPDRVVYRQQFIDGNSIKASDGLVVFEKLTNDSTRVSVIYFFEADFGPFRGLIEGKIWKKSMEGSFKDDIAFRAKVEHPDWSLDKISDEAEDVLDHNPIKDVEYTDVLKFE